MSDEELLALIARGDAQAFDRLYDRHAAFINGVCCKILRSRDEAEEVVHEILMELWEGKLQFRPGLASLKTWLYRIARNRCLDRLKASSRRLPHGPLPDDLLSPDGDDPEVDAQAAETRERVRRALDELSPEQREAIEYCFFKSPTYREAAEALGIPLGTLKSRVRLAIVKLAISLGEAGDRS
jgi:RNA polymerase sigma-70 factor (ECF subfamily)